MGRQEGMHSEGARVFDWLVEPCLQSAAPRAHIPAQNDWPAVSYRQACVTPIIIFAWTGSLGPNLVEVFPRAVEWDGIHSRSQVGPRPGVHIGCLRIAGLWCLIWKRMVSIPLGCQSTAPAHRGERAGSDSDHCSSVGSQLERLLRHMLLWQPNGSCSNEVEIIPG